MTDALYTYLHHAGFYARKTATPEADWVKLVAGHHPHPELAIWDFMEQRNANVVAYAQSRNRPVPPLMVRLHLNGVPHWTPQPERVHPVELQDVFDELDKRFGKLPRKPVEKSLGHPTPEEPQNAPHGPENRVSAQKERPND